MGLLHPSYLYPDSPDSRDAIESPTLLEARKLHFCLSPFLHSAHHLNIHPYERVGRWTVFIPNGMPPPVCADSAFGNDVIHGSLPAQTAPEVTRYINTLVCKGGTLEGWRSRIRNYHGNGHCFDIFFLRHRILECANEPEVPAGTPEPVVGEREPQLETEWWPEPVMETALAREDSLGYDPYLAGDTTRDSDSDYVPSTPRADSEARRQRVARSPRQMRGVARTQNELEDGRDGMVTEVRRAAEAQNEGERGGVILPYSPLRWHHWYL